MKKSELLLSKIQKAQELLEQVDALQQEVFAGAETEGDTQCFETHMAIQDLISTFDDIAYEVVSPIQVAEDFEEKKIELASLKARVAELENELCYAPEPVVIDLGSGMYDAREGNEDSFSNLDK